VEAEMVDSPQSPAHPLAQSHAEILERALATNAAARASVEQAMDLVAVSQALRRERDYWRQILEGLDAGSERLIPVCAYCDRVRAREGLWERIPTGVMQLLHHSKVIDVTHGICPVCVLTHFPVLTKGTERATGEATVVIKGGEVLKRGVEVIGTA
jgi:hypothetical protein